MKYDAALFRRIAENPSAQRCNVDAALLFAVDEAERLRKLYDHAIRCADPEHCVDDKGSPLSWRGCTENALNPQANSPG